MRGVVILVVISTLVTGCGSYYEKVNKDSTVDPNPHTYFDRGDVALLDLRDGSRVAGEVKTMSLETITVGDTVVQWSNVVSARKNTERVAMSIGAMALVAGLAILMVVGFAELSDLRLD